MGVIRLDKIISNRAGVSRGEAGKLIRGGRVSVAGETLRNPAAKPPQGAEIALDGRSLSQSGPRYIMLHKPEGVLSATEDRDQKTVLDILPEDVKRGLFPVGRLDKDVTGLLLLTDDGDFCHRATSPRSYVSKTYKVVTASPVSEEDVDAFAEGIVLGDGTLCRSARLTIDSVDKCRCTLVITQGIYHQVKRMFASRGKPVTALHRSAMGALELDPGLKPGEWKMLTDQEAQKVFQKSLQNRNKSN